MGLDIAGKLPDPSHRMVMGRKGGGNPMLKLWRRFQYLIRQRRTETELAEEMEFHRAVEQQWLESNGVDRDDAAFASRRVLGNVALAREDARDVWIMPWLQSVCQDGDYAVRIVRRSPAFAVAMILVMGVGIGATTGVFSLLDGLVLRSLPVREPDRLVVFAKPGFSYPLFREVWARGSHIFSDFFAWNIERMNVQWTNGLEPAEVLMASGEFYATLGVTAVAGGTFGPEDDRIGGGPRGLVAVISHACWQRRFSGDASIIGRTVRIDRAPFTIIGVTPPGFFGVAAGFSPDVTIPLTSLLDAETLRTPSSSGLNVMGRVRGGLTMAQANAALQSIWPAALEVTTSPGEPADRRAMYLGRTTALEPGRTGFSSVRNQFQEALWLLLALVALLLTVASASAANLLLARGVARRREIAVRLAIGASRSRLVRQMLTEALVWSSLGAAVGVLLAGWGSRALVTLMSTWKEPIALDVSPNWRVLTFTLVLAFLTTALSAVLPGLRATRLDPNAALKDGGQVGGSLLRRWSLDKALVGAQVALTVLLLVGAALFVRSLQRVLAQDAGFEQRNLLVLSTEAMAAGYKDARLTTFYAGLLERLGTLPGVESASLSWYPPISDDMGHWTQSIAVDGAPVQPGGERYVYFNAVSPEYFRTLGIRLLRGRPFAPADTDAAPNVVIVNESLARRYFGADDPVGRRISIGRHTSRQDLQIVGIVSDAKYQRLQEITRSIAYLPCAQLFEMTAGVNLVAEIRAAGGAAAVSERLKREVHALDAGVPVRIETVADRIDASLVRERVIAILAVVLGLSALTLACAGLFGLLSYAVSRHTREIGLRLALGATRTTVLWTVLRESLAVAAFGIAIALPAAAVLGRFARALLFQITPLDPVSLLGSSVVMLALAACAGLIPARRAARLDPAVALRME
jgi:predicted permease